MICSIIASVFIIVGIALVMGLTPERVTDDLLHIIEPNDSTAMYWASLSVKFNDVQRQQLRMQAQKVPRKVKRLSMCLLVCFMLIYVVVILEQIMSSIGVLFA